MTTLYDAALRQGCCLQTIGRTRLMRKAGPIVRSAMDRLESLELTKDEIRRLMENELALRRATRMRKHRA
jgi:hypothetical protein